MWQVWRVFLPADCLALLASTHSGFILFAQHVDALMVYAAVVWLVKADPVGLQTVKGIH